MTSKTLKKSVVAVAIAAALTGAYSINSEHALWPAQASAQQPKLASAEAAAGVSAATPMTVLPRLLRVTVRRWSISVYPAPRKIQRRHSDFRNLIRMIRSMNFFVISVARGNAAKCPHAAKVPDSFCARTVLC